MKLSMSWRRRGRNESVDDSRSADIGRDDCGTWLMIGTALATVAKAAAGERRPDFPRDDVAPFVTGIAALALESVSNNCGTTLKRTGSEQPSTSCAAS